MRTAPDTVDSDKPGRLPYVFIQRVRCPDCGSARVKTVRSMPREHDESRMRYAECKDCKISFVVVVE